MRGLKACATLLVYLAVSLAIALYVRGTFGFELAVLVMLADIDAAVAMLWRDRLLPEVWG